MAITSDAAVMCHSDLADVRLFAKTDLDPSQRAIVDVEDAWPANRSRIDPQRVAAEKVVVQERRAQVVGGGNGVQVAREMDVDLLHWQDLASSRRRQRRP